jgi:hypothetical protein
VDITKKVLERLAVSDKTTIVIEKQPDGKMRVTSGSWDWEKVIFKDQGRNASSDGRLHVARKTKRDDDCDPRQESLSDEFIDD